VRDREVASLKSRLSDTSQAQCKFD
jgi:hypothetical protein